ncbi:MAG: class I SAM-dependent methyltransferase [Chitinophagales bacterium]|nr:class I SAM-dependent methyltransferase [Chitinophagales bacterium]
MENKLKKYARLDFFKKWVIGVVVVMLMALLADQYTESSVFIYCFSFIVIATLIIVFRIVQLILKRLEERSDNYNQIESLFSIYHYLKPQGVFPKMRNHAGAPDFLKLILTLLQERQPKVIVEASSGISSMVVSEWLLQHSPKSQHYALEHEEKYALLTRSNIQNPNSHILHAPITNYEIDGNNWQWYAMDEKIKALSSVDLLIVDGPPVHLQKNARFPALPLLVDKMNTNSIILLDDGNRLAEKNIVELWCKQYGFSKEYIPLEKGAYILRKK